MLLRLGLATLVALLLTLPAAGQAVHAQPPARAVLVKLAPSAALEVEAHLETSRRSGDDALAALAAVPRLANASSRTGVTSARRLFRTDPRHDARHRSFGLDRWYVLEVAPSDSVTAESAAATFMSVLEVEKATVDQVLLLESAQVRRVECGTAGASFPDDPCFDEQWSIHNTAQSGGLEDADVDLPEAWAVTTGSQQVIVHVNDGGIDLDHPDLADALWTNPGEISGNGLDDDGNGYIDDVHGWSFIRDSNDLEDTNGHGTQVSGIIAATTNNGIGISGIAGGSGVGDGVKLLLTQWTAGSGSFSTIVAGMVYAADNGAVISNNSHTGALGNTDVWVDAADYFTAVADGALEGGLVVSPAGNDFQNRPREFGGQILVAATTDLDQKAPYSGFGMSVDVSAPGGHTQSGVSQGILTTALGGGYVYSEGTSYATPHVAGLAALYASANPGVTVSAVVNAIKRSTDGLDVILPANLRGKMGTGRVNAARMLGLSPAQTHPVPSLSVLEDGLEVRLLPGQDSTRAVAVSNASGAGPLLLTASVDAAVRPADADDAYGYTLSRSGDLDGPAVGFVDISQSGTALDFGLDYSASISLPFAFPFYGTTQRSAAISIFGHIAFGGSATLFGNEPIPFADDRSTITAAGSGPAGVIAPFWDVLFPPQGGTIYTDVLEDGRWVVQWNEVVRFGETQLYTFQTLLSPDGTIEFQYDQLTGPTNSATVGIESLDETDGIEVAYNTAVASESAVRFVPPPQWATVALEAETVDAGDATDLEVVFDASDLEAGLYSASVVLTSNDPLATSRSIPLELRVDVAALVVGEAGWRLFGPPAEVTVEDVADLNLVQGIEGQYPDAPANFYTYTSGAGWSAPASDAVALPRGYGFSWYLYNNDLVPNPASLGGGTSESRALPFVLAAPCCQTETDQTVTLSGAPDSAGNWWVLLANPFDTPLRLDRLGSQIGGNDVWAGASNLASDEAQVYNPATGSYQLGSVAGAAGVWEGFWVLNGSGSTLTIPASEADVARTRSDDRPRIAFALEGASPTGRRLLDQAAMLVFDDGALPGPDRRDAPKLSPLDGTFVMLGLEVDDGSESVLQAKASVPLQRSVEIDMVVQTAGALKAVTLTWPTLDLPDGWTATLHDLEGGKEIDLLTATEYAFEIQPGRARMSTSATPRLALAASGATRFQLTVAGLGTAAEDEDGTDLSLAVSPNPTAGAFSAAFHVLEGGPVRLALYDVLGREVAVLEDRVLAAGDHSAALEGGLAPGIYVARLTAGERSLTRAVTVVR